MKAIGFKIKKMALELLSKTVERRNKDIGYKICMLGIEDNMRLCRRIKKMNLLNWMKSIL
jgi:hypothetical protein